MESEKMTVVLGRKKLSVKCIPVPNLHRYLGDPRRTVTPLDQFYLDAMNVASLTFDCIIDKGKVFVCEKDFHVMFMSMIRFLAPFFDGNMEMAQRRAGLIWRQAGPTVADFVPEGCVAVEEGYILVRAPRANEIPPKSQMH